MASYYDKPPRYDYNDRLVVDTLYDLRARARKHAELIAAHTPVPVSPVSPLLSDGSSAHTFNIDLESIWADDEEDEDEVSSSSAGPSSPRSPVLQPPRRVSSVSSFFIDGDDDEEPAPAYEYEESQDSASTWGPASTARLSSSTIGNEFAKQTPMVEEDDEEEEEDLNEVLWDEDEDPWSAFAADCWSACVDDSPQPPRAPRRAPEPIQLPSRPRASSLATISTGPRPPSPLVIAAPLPGTEDPSSPYEGRKFSLDSTATSSSYATTRSDGAGGLVYKSSFARTEPDLGIWRAPAPGDTAIVRPLGADESRLMGFESTSTDTLELQVDDVRHESVESGTSRALTRLEYRRPRKPSPPRVDAQFSRAATAAAAKGSMWSPDTPTPSMADIGAFPPSRGASGNKGFRNLWRRATGKENATAHLGGGRPVYAGF